MSLEERLRKHLERAWWCIARADDYLNEVEVSVARSQLNEPWSDPTILDPRDAWLMRASVYASVAQAHFLAVEAIVKNVEEE